MMENVQDFENGLHLMNDAELFAIARNFITREILIELLKNTLSEGDREDILNPAIED